MRAPSLLLSAALLCLPFFSRAQADDLLVELINGYRAAPVICEGRTFAPLPSLASDARLMQAAASGQAQLGEAMQSSGYRAVRVEFISLAGPRNAHEAFDFAVRNHCRLLLDARYSAVGVTQQGAEWRIVMAQPLLSPDIGDWQQAGKEVLRRVNTLRAQARRCGEQHFESAEPLRWNDSLAAAALKHSEDMARHSYFSHRGRDGRFVDERVKAEDYRAHSVGENIAAGQGAAQDVVRSWLVSPEHCANIMNPAFTEMGTAYAYDPGSEAGIYWTQVFGAPQ